MTDLMITAHGVSKRFFTQPVLHDVSFEVQRGSSLVILGQSGIGKSVLLKILARLILPDDGTVRIATADIGMLFQKNALFDSMTVSENLDFPLRERTGLGVRQRKEKITRFLDWVGLSGTESLYPDELSGGMQKRLAIARALIVEPQLLLCDEPTAGLDPITSRMIAELLLRLKAELGTTFVVVTSDIMRAFQLGERIGLLVPSSPHGGAHLVEAGTPDEARASRDPAIHQFLHGLAQGPLASHAEDFNVPHI